ncbi:enoyl-CoA hydratase/isomerase family protein [Pseudomonas monsensis]|uniref:enoyl-CoA hydratase-related protein n=1 Tax=Pseudomonas monsensis TaxID=2745509 RepID=UPI001644317F|nr:enoyl-CoA hydratase-related protein [Pseudomonas monsensis]QXH98604.1 enoyl-CoA hydratase/isomerase family protein [Pseudomonas monsensis]
MNLLIERQGRVVLIRLNRPQARNALNTEMMRELLETLHGLDTDPGVGCFVITGTKDYFAAGADIKEMHEKSCLDMIEQDYFAGWDAFARLRTPKVAAVAGYAYGGGCELAMMCDLIIAAESATFALPEITLGVMPGMGGTQRLTRLIGRAKSMDMILTGRSISAREAEQAGLLSRVTAADQLLEQALAVAQRIAGFPRTATLAAREAVDRALESGLSDGILFERRVFHGLFATPAQKEGMQAFLEKREPRFDQV